MKMVRFFSISIPIKCVHTYHRCYLSVIQLNITITSILLQQIINREVDSAYAESRLICCAV